jgi:hypothetical protein
MMKDFLPLVGREALERLRLEASKKGVDLEKDVAARGFDFSSDLKNDKVLYFRAKMLGYDLPNGNGDAIPRVYAADFGPSFIGKHLDLNHETDVQNIIGKVVSTFHVEAPLPGDPGEERIIGKNALSDDDSDATRELQLEGICRIDRNTDLGELVAQKLIAGTIDGVSQEASTEYATCSVCGHKVSSPFDAVCAHLENGSLMIKSFQVEGRKHKVLAYKEHHNPVGTGLAIVTVPAYDRGRVQEIAAQVKSGKLPLEAALLDLKEQAILYKKPAHIMEAIESLQANKTTIALDSALSKLNGHETLALLEKFKAPIELRGQELKKEEEGEKVKASDAEAEDAFRSAKEHAHKAGDLSESAEFQASNIYDTDKPDAKKFMRDSIRNTVKKAKEHIKEANDDLDKGENSLEAIFFRRPNKIESYWAIISKPTGQVLTRVSIGALSGGKINRVLSVQGRFTTLAKHLTSTSWAQDLVSEAKRRGASSVLAELKAAQHAWDIQCKEASALKDQRRINGRLKAGRGKARVREGRHIHAETDVDDYMVQASKSTEEEGKGKPMCDICQERPAVSSSYRTWNEGTDAETTGTVLECQRCARLDNYWAEKVMNGEMTLEEAEEGQDFNAKLKPRLSRLQGTLAQSPKTPAESPLHVHDTKLSAGRGKVRWSIISRIKPKIKMRSPRMNPAYPRTYDPSVHPQQGTNRPK